jgi:hypothetical protein
VYLNKSLICLNLANFGERVGCRFLVVLLESGKVVFRSRERTRLIFAAGTQFLLRVRSERWSFHL